MIQDAFKYFNIHEQMNHKCFLILNEHHFSEPCRLRKQRDWNEDDRRRRKEKMRLDIEKENMKSLTSPTKKPICFKRISPDDRTALHILDGTSQAKSKRIRPKTRR